MKVRDYIELPYHPTWKFVIKSARTGKILLDGRRSSYFGKLSKVQKAKLDKYMDWEVSSIEPLAVQNGCYITLGFELSVPEWNGEQ